MGAGSKLFQERYRAARAGQQLSRSARKRLAAAIKREIKELTRGEQCISRRLFGDCRILSPSGELMFRTYRARFDFYLARTESRLISEDPPTLQLLFEPGGVGYIGDDYHLAERLNRCVVCGAESFLTRHHVLPRMLRRHYPKTYRRRNQHDVLPLCIHCHDEYEAHADRRKRQLFAQHGLPPRSSPMVPDPLLAAVARAAWALHKHGEQMPAARRRELLEPLLRYFGKGAGADVGADELAAARRLDPMVPNPTHVDIGRELVKKVDLQEQLEDWRRHFVETMRPRHLPPGWDLKRPMAQDLERDAKDWPWELAAARGGAAATVGEGA